MYKYNISVREWHKGETSDTLFWQEHIADNIGEALALTMGDDGYKLILSDKPSISGKVFNADDFTRETRFDILIDDETYLLDITIYRSVA